LDLRPTNLEGRPAAIVPARIKISRQTLPSGPARDRISVADGAIHIEEGRAMKPAFQTSRMIVYKTEIDREPEGAFDLYLAYERAASDHPYRQIVECSTASGDNCVLWVESRQRPREGFALELLNGIARHQRFKEAMYPNYTISGMADALFAKHADWFKNENLKRR
jgi:hypothetical protein